MQGGDCGGRQANHSGASKNGPPDGEPRLPDAQLVNKPEAPQRQDAKACQACAVSRKDLGNPRYDIVKNARSADGLREDLAYVASIDKKQKRLKMSRALGVVVLSSTNPADSTLPPSSRGCSCC
ncbi:unnamed protein product [Ectocarpus sp. 12 AP-2014]